MKLGQHTDPHVVDRLASVRDAAQRGARSSQRPCRQGFAVARAYAMRGLARMKLVGDSGRMWVGREREFMARSAVTDLTIAERLLQSADLCKSDSLSPHAEHVYTEVMNRMGRDFARRR